ncbi:MAG: response regulator [Clostridia bacterium]|nr:response regulator [Clostridia bacterium]
MIVIAVDDEALALKSLADTIKKIKPDAEIYLFRDPMIALQSLESGVVKPDVIFSDIQMFDMTGIQFAHRVKVIYPHTNIVFVTGYSEYMMDAIRLHASGYLLKPIDEDQLREQFDNLIYPTEDKGNGQKFYAQTFGNFEFYCNGSPVHFARAKAKELLAYLIDKNGAACTRAELLVNVFDDGAASGDQSLSQAYSVLSKTLSSLGGGDIIIKSHNAYAINPQKFGCDYYDYLKGDVRAINAYQGVYMANYATWSDLTGPRKFRS